LSGLGVEAPQDSAGGEGVVVLPERVIDSRLLPGLGVIRFEEEASFIPLDRWLNEDDLREGLGEKAELAAVFPASLVEGLRILVTHSIASSDVRFICRYI
jgi:hypothetical protein